MSATETIIAFGAGQILNKIFGGAAPVFTGYHKVHFILLARALGESQRDWELQEALRAIRRNVQELTGRGKALLETIPPEPAPPEANVGDLADPTARSAYDKQIQDYATGLKIIIDILQDFVTASKRILEGGESDLRQIERRLTLQDSKLAGMRGLSIHNREIEIFEIRQRDMPALRRQSGEAEKRLKTYLG